MTARVLVVDDILANVKLLEARLQAEYFEVLTANSGRQAAPSPPPAAPPQLDRSRLAALQQATGGDVSLSLAAGLKVRRVVIDLLMTMATRLMTQATLEATGCC